MIQKGYFIVIISCVCFFQSACATPALWKATNPNEYLKIPASDISEAELKSKKVKYHRDETDSVYYIQKSNFVKLKDYSLRFFATPVTVVVDAGLAILIVGTLGVISVIENDERKEERGKYNEEVKCNFNESCNRSGNGMYRY